MDVEKMTYLFVVEPFREETEFLDSKGDPIWVTLFKLVPHTKADMYIGGHEVREFALNELPFPIEGPLQLRLPGFPLRCQTFNKF